MKPRRFAPASFAGWLAELGWPGGTDLPTEDALRARDAWRARYGAALHARTGHWADGGYEWHAFGDIPCAQLDAAIALYSAQRGRVLVITAYLEHDLHGASFESPPPAATWTGRRKFLPPDLLVFPPDLSWTFAVTHEWGWCGPYFAPFTPPPPVAPAPAKARRRKRNGSRR